MGSESSLAGPKSGHISLIFWAFPSRIEMLAAAPINMEAADTRLRLQVLWLDHAGDASQHLHPEQDQPCEVPLPGDCQRFGTLRAGMDGVFETCCNGEEEKEHARKAGIS